MKSAFRPLVFSCLVASGVCWTRPVSATTIDPLLFEELILGADFAGIVECKKAGGIVAEYQVVESWKGPKAGSRVTIRVSVNYWEPQFPIALCGERYFVTAYKEAPSRIMSTTSGGGVPLWWRDIPADYRLPLFQGRQLLAPGEDKTPAFEKTRKAAQALLALKPPQQEAALLTAVIEKDFFGRRWAGGESAEDKVKTLRAGFAKLTTADALVGELLRLVKADPEKWGVRTRIVLEKAGGTVALDRLEKLPADQLPWEKRERDELIEQIKRRCGMVETQPVKKEPLAKEDAPKEAELANQRKNLTGGPGSKRFGEALLILTRHDPVPVAEYLAGWKNPNEDWRDADRGYVLGSYFACQCGKERKKYLQALLDAKDPFIRVAGAVYLSFEDAELGVAALKKLTTLKGDPGAWAALTLARRGEKDAMSRAVELFRDLPGEQKAAQFGMAGVPHRNLQKRLLVLISNSACASGILQPLLPKEPGEQWEYLTNWWKQHRDKVVLQDPWLKMLEKQKID